MMRDHRKPVVISAEELADLDRQSAAIDLGEEPTFPHELVERWILTWGTPNFKPWPVWLQQNTGS